MIYKRKRNLLVVTPVTTHPQNSGNRARIYTMLEELQSIGYAVHVLYDGSEISSGHVKKKHDIRAMKKKWDSVFYVPNMVSAKLWRKIFESNNNFSEVIFRILLFFVSFFPSRSFFGEKLDNTIGHFGKFIQKTLPTLYFFLKRFFPDGKFNLKKDIVQDGIDSMYNSRTDYMVRLLEEKLNFQVVLVEYVFMSKALEVFDKSVRKIIDTHDVFSDRRHKYHAEGLKDFSFSTTACEEGKGLSRADVVIAIQDNEKNYLETITDSLVMTVGHIVSICEEIIKVRDKTILFVGTANPGNIHAMKQFTEEVWPEVISKVPDAELIVAGKVSNYVRRGRGIVRLGEVKDINKIYEKARFVINPTKIGTGLKIKSIEALGFGKPVIVSSHSAIGLAHMRGAIVISRTKKEWVGFILHLLLDDKLRNKMSKKALEFAQDNNKKVKVMIRRVFGGYLPNYEFRMAPVKKQASNSHFLIFTWPRCGATTLAKVLEEHPDIKIKDEPFNHQVGEKILPADMDRLKSYMSEIRSSYEGIKHNWGLTFEQNMELLSSGDSVVFLTRQNALQRVVSEIISKQTESWNSSRKEHKKAIKETLGKLDVNEIKKKLHEYIWEINQYKKFLKKQGIPYYDLTYEDLYGSNVSHKKKIVFIKELLKFIGKDQDLFDTNDKIQKLLNPGISKANSEETYLKISNIEDVEDILGSDEFGWLFED